MNRRIRLVDAERALAEVQDQTPAERVLRALQEDRLSDNGKAAIEVRKRIAAAPASPHDLSDQQWRFVCRFYPNIAARAGRAIVNAAPAQAPEGTFLQAFRLPNR